MEAISALLAEGGDKEPELMELAFSCLAYIWKWLQKPLAQDLALALRLTLPLRTSRVPHVREFAAGSLAFLFRSAQPAAVPQGMHALLAEVALARADSGGAGEGAARPDAGIVVDAAGALLADACKVRACASAICANQQCQAPCETSPSSAPNFRCLAAAPTAIRHSPAVPPALQGAMQGVHSRAGRLFAFVTEPKLPAAEELVSAGQADGAPPAELTRVAWEAAAFAVAENALERILAHTRRGAGEPIWGMLLDPVGVAARHAEAAGPTEAERAAERLARAVALVAQATEHRRGSRVVRCSPNPSRLSGCSPADTTRRQKHVLRPHPRFRFPLSPRSRLSQEAYEPLAKLAERLLGKSIPLLTAASPAAVAEGSGPESLAAACAREALRLVVAVLAGQKAVAGASAGPQVAAAFGASVAGLLERCQIPARHLRAFTRKVIKVYFCPPEALVPLGPALLRALAACSPAGEAAAGDAESLLLCADLLGALFQANECRPVSATQQWSERAAAALGAWDGVPSGTEGPEVEGAAAAAWGALQVLPFGVTSAATARVAEELARKAADTAARLAGAVEPRAEGAEARSAASLMFRAVEAAAVEAARASVSLHSASSLAALAADALLRLRAAPASVPLMRAAADALDAASNAAPAGGAPAPAGATPKRKKGSALPGTAGTPAASGRGAADLSHEALLGTWLPLLEANLSAPCSALRHETLRVLCHFDPGALSARPAGTEDLVGTPTETPTRVTVFEDFRVASSSGDGENMIDFGRHCAVLIGEHGRLARAGRVPSALVPALARALLGCLRTKLAILWPHSQAALAALLDSHPHATFGVLRAQLEASQREFLLSAHPGGFHAGASARPGHWNQGSGAGGWHGQGVEVSATERLRATAAQLDDSTDCSTLHGLIIRTLTKAPGALGPAGVKTALGRELIGLLFEFTDPGPDGEPRHGKRFRSGLRDYLGLLEALGGGKGFAEAPRIRALLERLLGDAEPSVQRAAIACLRAFRLKHFSPYADRLLRIIAHDSMRDEMTAFSLAAAPADGSAPAIEPVHRPLFVPLLIQLIFPLLKKKCASPEQPSGTERRLSLTALQDRAAFAAPRSPLLSGTRRPPLQAGSHGWPRGARLVAHRRAHLPCWA